MNHPLLELTMIRCWPPNKPLKYGAQPHGIVSDPQTMEHLLQCSKLDPQTMEHLLQCSQLDGPCSTMDLTLYNTKGQQCTQSWLKVI